MVCKIMGWASDGTLEHEKWFEGGRWVVYKVSVVGIGEFPFLLSLLVLLDSKASYHCETVSTLVLSWFPRNESRASCPASDITLVLPLSPMLDPARYTSLTTSASLPTSEMNALNSQKTQWWILNKSTNNRIIMRPPSRFCEQKPERKFLSVESWMQTLQNNIGTMICL
jgi:hypothetical protein